MSPPQQLQRSRLTLRGSVVWMSLLLGCAAPDMGSLPAGAPAPIYDTLEDLEAMPPLEARVIRHEPCCVFLRTPDGRSFCIGGPAAGSDVVRFAHSLKDGQSYTFPETLKRHQEEARADSRGR